MERDLKLRAQEIGMRSKRECNGKMTHFGKQIEHTQSERDKESRREEERGRRKEERKTKGREKREEEVRGTEEGWLKIMRGISKQRKPQAIEIASNASRRLSITRETDVNLPPSRSVLNLCSAQAGLQLKAGVAMAWLGPRHSKVYRTDLPFRRSNTS